MSQKNAVAAAMPGSSAVPLPVLVVLRGIGQVFFQESALTGALFVLGLALSSPIMAAGAVVGSAIGALVARGLKFDPSELTGGIFGFNAALVGIAAFFFFPPSLLVVGLMVAGCVVATLLTRAMRQHVPFPTYTTPFVVTTWGVFFLAKALGAVPDPGAAPIVPNADSGFYLESTLHGIGQVMFQGSIWTGLCFLLGIALNDQRHALLVLAGSIVGMLVALYHFTLGADAVDPERLVTRTAFDVIKLGLYGYNATLAPVALYLWKRSLLAPVLGMLLTVPLTELVPMLGLPALTAPFVLAVWLLLALSWLERQWVGSAASSS